MAQQHYHLDLRDAYQAVEGVWADEEDTTGQAESGYHIGGTGRAVQVTPDTAAADAKFRAECERQGIEYTASETRRDWT